MCEKRFCVASTGSDGRGEWFRVFERSTGQTFRFVRGEKRVASVLAEAEADPRFKPRRKKGK